jgi:N-acetylneuraminic acid mutarotase
MRSVIVSTIVFAMIFLLITPAASDRTLAQGDSWKTKAPMPTARQYPAGAAIDGRLYVVGGANSSGIVAILQVYDPRTDSWTTKASAIIPRSLAGAAAIDGKLFVVDGYGGNCVRSELEVYDPLTDTWTLRAPDPIARFQPGVTAINGKLYVAGGVTDCNFTTDLTTLEVYDPATDTWTIKAPMPTRRESPSVVAINGKLYSVGGVVRPDGIPTGALEVYDPATDTWTTKAPMPTARQLLGVGIIDGRLHAVGGAAPSFLDTHEVYDPATDTWTTKAPMPTRRAGFVADVIGSQLYAVGGGTSITLGQTIFVNTLEVYTPVNDAPKAICRDVIKPADNNCQAAVTPQEVSNGSFDPDGDPITLSLSPAGPYPFGTTQVTLTVTDTHGAFGQCTASVTVLDNTPPAISAATATPNRLWPPNHKMVPVMVTVAVSDNCGAVSCKIISVTSNEPPGADAVVPGDAVITGNLTLNLRAERSGNGTGRIYTITIQCTDGSGNNSTGAVTVGVQRDQGH